MGQHRLSSGPAAPSRKQNGRHARRRCRSGKRTVWRRIRRCRGGRQSPGPFHYTTFVSEGMLLDINRRHSLAHRPRPLISRTKGARMSSRRRSPTGERRSRGAAAPVAEGRASLGIVAPVIPVGGEGARDAVVGSVNHGPFSRRVAMRPGTAIPAPWRPRWRVRGPSGDYPPSLPRPEGLAGRFWPQQSRLRGRPGPAFLVAVAQLPCTMSVRPALQHRGSVPRAMDADAGPEWSFTETCLADAPPAGDRAALHGRPAPATGAARLAVNTRVLNTLSTAIAGR